MRKLFLMCQTTGPAETRFLADPLPFWQTHCRCSFAHACGKNGEQWTISRSQGPVMDGCLPDPDKKYPLRSDGPANFAFSGIMPGFSTEKDRSILMLTSTCWQEISLSNTVELTTVTPQKQEICRLNVAFCWFSKIPEVPLSAYAQQILWRVTIGWFCFYVRLLAVTLKRGRT